MLSRPPPTGEKHLHLFIPTQNQRSLRSRRYFNCLHTIARIALLYSPASQISPRQSPLPSLVDPRQSSLVAMRPFTYLVTALAVLPGAFAVDQKKSAIVWFDDASTPDSIVNDAKNTIIQAGGKITHVYNIIKSVNAAQSYVLIIC